MLRGFNGEYIEPGPSGAPSSGGADLLPTGRNFFGIDPRTLPTPAAWEIGKTLAEQVIARFIEEEGHYPENIGIVLWSGANMRSHGQCIAEFLYLLGIKPKYQSGSQRVNGLEVIPLTELQRPRIDVTARISGLFRDSMPAVMNLLDKAVLLAAAQDEDLSLNYVRKHVQEDSKELEETEGMNKEDAWRQAAFRILVTRKVLMVPVLLHFWKRKTGKLLMILPMFMFVGVVMLMAVRPVVNICRNSSVNVWVVLILLLKTKIITKRICSAVTITMLIMVA